MLKRIPERFAQSRLLLSIIFGVVFLDQITKYLARVFLRPHHSVSVIGDFFRLTYVENPGIAFGIRIENKLFFSILSIIAIVVIFYYLLQLRERPTLRFAFAVILGGAFGNLIDRFLFGRVVDFFDFEFFNIHIPEFKLWFIHFNGYAMERWPVFNIADIAVSEGMIIIILNALFDDEKNHKKSADAVLEED